MRFFTCTLSSLVVAALLWPATLAADILAYESFLYPDGARLTGQTNGGSGWSGPWNLSDNIASASIERGALIFGEGTQNPLLERSKTSALSRSFNAYTGQNLFLKFTFMLGPGTTADPDRFLVVLSGKGNGGGWGNLETGTGLAHNHGGDSIIGDRRITARVYSTAGHRVTSSVIVSDSVEYTVVVEFAKETPALDARYNRLRLWLNPTKDDYEASPARPLAYPQILHMVNKVTIALDETEAGDVIRLYDIMIATSWEDVTAGGSSFSDS